MRVFLIVLDSFGIGASYDAEKFGDAGSNTLKAVSESMDFRAPNLIKLGLGNIDNVNCIPKTSKLCSTVMRLTPLSPNKDTTSGHWELMGLVADKFPTYPNGFPEELILKLESAFGRKILCNKPYSGTEVIKDYGEKHIESGDLIVYTSADSVLQIAAHEEIVPPNELYEYCLTARKLMTGKDAVARVIARPFLGEKGNFYRTGNRRDFSLPPTAPTTLDRLKEKGASVIAIGKINDIFAGHGISRAIHSSSNEEGMKLTSQIAKTMDFDGLCFTNLVDFDMLYGHRNDRDGYARAISAFDIWLGNFIAEMREDDVLVITADHGCDPITPSTDHSREDVPAIFYGNLAGEPKNLGTITGFGTVGKMIEELLSDYHTFTAKT